MNLLELLNDGFFNKYQNIQTSNWIEWHDEGGGASHCGICKALNMCWFRDDNKPAMPQHYMCHCKRHFISQPIPGETGQAQCKISKFTEYIFSDKYSFNGKRALFEELGFTAQDASYLQEEYQRQAEKQYCNGNYRLGKLDTHGQRIDIEISLQRNGRSIKLVTGWMVRPQGTITNNTPLGGKSA